jgi:hypothetical protein
MTLNVTGGRGRLLISAKEAKAVRATFIERVYRAAALAGIEPPPREAFLRTTSNPTYRVWVGIGGCAEQARASVCLEWLEPLLGFERFIVDTGPRPILGELRRLDTSLPYGPHNVSWSFAVPYIGTGRPPPVVVELRRQKVAELAAKHGISPQDLKRRPGYWLYDTWTKVLARCTNPKAKSYRYYGGRGIRVCELWDDWTLGFELFAGYILSELGARPEGCTLDRMDTNQDYEHGNVQWATTAQQRVNRRPKGHKAPMGWVGARRATAEFARLKELEQRPVPAE